MIERPPIALFVYDRPIHTGRVLEALSLNDGARESDLLIFCDGPKGEEDLSRVGEVREVVRRPGVFRSVELFEQKTNKGLASSIIDGVSRVLEKYDRVIVLEDDLVTSPHFLNYMNGALTTYAEDLRVYSVSGFNLPPRLMQFPRSYPDDLYFNPRSSSWGWGTWRNRWAQADWEVADFDKLMSDPQMQRRFEEGGQDLTRMLVAQQEGRIDSWSIRWSFTHFLKAGLAVYPVRSYVNNTGLDGTGSNCSVDETLGNDLALSLPRVDFPSEPLVDDGVMRAFRRQYARGRIPILWRAANRSIAGSKNNGEPGLKVVKINNHDTTGGAGLAAWRLHEGLVSIGVDSKVVVRVRRSGSERALERDTRLGKLSSRVQTTLDKAPLKVFRQRQKVPFSLDWCPTGIVRQVTSLSPDIVHLHWVGGGQVSVREISKLGRPIVWTLHDMWAFTGGCHYDDGCGRYTGSCGRCPLLGSRWETDVTNLLWRMKNHFWRDLDLTVVCPSNWLANCARKSGLLKKNRIEVIPNGLDLEVNRPISRDQARETLGLSPDVKLIMFGAMNAASDRRKGFDHLMPALKLVSERLADSTELVVFGSDEPAEPPEFGMRASYLGQLDDEQMINLAYSSADVIVVPSKQDNLPNVVTESLASATPVVAFDIGGMGDMVEHRTNGYLASPFDAADLARGIVWALEDEGRLKSLGEAARRKTEEEFEQRMVARRYLALYRDILGIEDSSSR